MYSRTLGWLCSSSSPHSSSRRIVGIVRDGRTRMGYSSRLSCRDKCLSTTELLSRLLRCCVLSLHSCLSWSWDGRRWWCGRRGMRKVWSSVHCSHHALPLMCSSNDWRAVGGGRRLTRISNQIGSYRRMFIDCLTSRRELVKLLTSLRVVAETARPLRVEVVLATLGHRRSPPVWSHPRAGRGGGGS